MIRNFTSLLAGIILLTSFTKLYAQPTVTDYSICQGLTVPAGQGLLSSTGGSTTATTLSGSIGSTLPTYTHGSGNSQTSYNLGFNITGYQTFTIIPPVSGTFSIPMLSGYDNYMTLYQGVFDPANPATNFLYGDDDTYGSSQAVITWNFVAGQPYTLVATSFSSFGSGAFTIPLPWTNGNVVEWYTASTGGTPIYIGALLNPVGITGSGVTNTNTLAATTFYAGYQGQTARTPGVFTIDGTVAVTPYTICQGSTVPVGQGLAGTATGTISWYSAATGGTALGTGTTFNPVGVTGSGITNTTTPGSTIFYAQATTCRVPVSFTVGATTTTIPYSICQGATVPAGQGLQVTNSGNASPTSISGSLSASSPTYVRSYGNDATTYGAGLSVGYFSYTFVAPVTGSFTIPLLTTYDNYVALYQGSFDPLSPATNFLFGDDDSYGSLQGRIVWNFVAGQTYVLVGSSFGGGVTGPLSFSLPFTPGPVVEWYTAATGGTAIATGIILNPVGVTSSGITNTATPGATTFYAAFAGSPCRTPAVFTINAATTVNISASGNSTICQGDSTLVFVTPGAGYNYQWLLNNTNITGATSASYKAYTTGSYSIAISATTVCAYSGAPYVLTVNALPVATDTIAGFNTVCVGDTIHFNANTGTGLTYQWLQNGYPLPGATNSSYNATVIAAYNVVVTNTNNCSATSTAINANILPMPVSAITSSGPLSFCSGSGVALNTYTLTTGTLSYQWYKDNVVITGATSSSTVAYQAGSYKIKIMNGTGCSGFSPPVTVSVNPTPVPPIYQSNDTLSTAVYPSYQWYNNAQPIAGATSRIYVITQTGVYNVAIADVNGCTGLSATKFSVPTGITSYTSSIDIKVYPNPVQDMVHVDAPVKLRLQVNDITGRMLIDNNANSNDLDVRSLAAGTYLLLLKDEQGKLLKVEKLQKAQ